MPEYKAVSVSRHASVDEYYSIIILSGCPVGDQATGTVRAMSPHLSWLNLSQLLKIWELSVPANWQRTSKEDVKVFCSSLIDAVSDKLMAFLLEKSGCMYTEMG